MKLTKTLLTISLALIMAFSLLACTIQSGGDETWEYSADTKEGCEELFNDFFKETLENTNMIVTMKGNGNPVSTETIDGTSDYITYATTGTETYSFIKDEEYIYAMTGDDSNYYMVGKDNYDYGYQVYKHSLNIFEALPEEGATYSCEVKGGTTDGNSTNNLTLEFKANVGSIKFEASSENDLVKTITITRIEEGQTYITDMTIEYGSASVTVPDISDWYKQEN